MSVWVGVQPVPEPFGFYVLESVHQGCPVYTNGVGNNRFLLPPEHGINVYETFDMVEDARGQRNPGAWRGVAERVIRDLKQEEIVLGQCKHGRRVIEAMWSLANFDNDLTQTLERFDEAEVPGVDFDAARVRLSPGGRGLNANASMCSVTTEIID